MYRENNINRLATNGPNKPKIIGDVFIHPSANVDPTAVVMLYNKLFSLTRILRKL
jgi:hypothetical protein